MTVGSNNGEGKGATDRGRLAEVLAAYGRNPLRWPEADRVRFARLLREPEQMPRDLSNEADQLDKLLDAAACVVEPEGARNRLLATIAAEKHLASTAAYDGTAGWQSVFVPQQLLAAGALAASIMLGVFIGAGTEAGMLLADSLQLPVATDDVLDTVLIDNGDDGSLL